MLAKLSRLTAPRAVAVTTILLSAAAATVLYRIASDDRPALPAHIAPALPAAADEPVAAEAPAEGGYYLAQAAEPAPAPEPSWSEYTIQSGDRLARLWQRDWELPLNTLYSLLNEPDSARHLNRIRVGQRFEWQQDETGELAALRLWLSQARGVEWVRTESGFERRELSQERQVQRLLLTGELNGNLSATLAAMDEIGPHAAALSAALDSKLPLRRQARDGDAFTLLLEQEWLADGDTPYDSRLLAFSYSGQRLAVKAVRHVDGRFYTPDGQSLIPPFDRYPFQGRYRLSSGFDPARRHPITRRVQPHNGTDFATPIGTPILAPSDGRVVRSSYNRLNGNYLVIDHGRGFETRYLHLQHVVVNPGQNVRRGQRVALSGNTGRSTGAHLHYELHINGRAVDPMRAQLPEAASLRGAELERFKLKAAPLLASLRKEDGGLLAGTDTGREGSAAEVMN